MYCVGSSLHDFLKVPGVKLHCLASSLGGMLVSAPGCCLTGEGQLVLQPDLPAQSPASVLPQSRGCNGQMTTLHHQYLAQPQILEGANVVTV